MIIYYVVFCHFACCAWISLGGVDLNKDSEERASWLFLKETQFTNYTEPAYEQVTDPKNPSNFQTLYQFSMIFIQQTLTTVGYGNTSYETVAEWSFVIVLEMVSVGMQALLLVTIWSILRLQDKAFDDIVFGHMTNLDGWLLKIQKAGHPYYLPKHLCTEIVKDIEEAFLFDFNIIIEEFDLYQKLPPGVQSQLITYIFPEFIERFNHFLGKCENGFRNELIIQMYTRRMYPNTEVIYNQKMFEEIYFVMQGKVELFSVPENVKFMDMPENTVFGEYQVIFNLKSNISYRTRPD